VGCTKPESEVPAASAPHVKLSQRAADVWLSLAHSSCSRTILNRDFPFGARTNSPTRDWRWEYQLPCRVFDETASGGRLEPGENADSTVFRARRCARTHRSGCSPSTP